MKKLFSNQDGMELDILVQLRLKTKSDRPIEDLCFPPDGAPLESRTASANP